MLGAKRAHIHHRDGNPANNPPDGSNWQVLCPECHRKLHDGTDRKYNKGGIHVTVQFARWKRKGILQSRNNSCELCGVKLGIGKDYSSKSAPKCAVCKGLVGDTKEWVLWRDGTTYCMDCIEKKCADGIDGESVDVEDFLCSAEKFGFIIDSSRNPPDWF